MAWEPSQRGSALQPGVTPHSQWHSASLTVLSSLFWVLAAFPTVTLLSICWVPAVSKTDIGPAMSGGREWAAKQQTHGRIMWAMTPALRPDLFPGAGPGGVKKGIGRVCWEESREAFLEVGKVFPGAWFQEGFPSARILEPISLPCWGGSVEGVGEGFCRPQGSAETAPLLFCLQSECKGQ